MNLKKTFEKYSFTWITGVNTLFHALCMEEWFLNNPPKDLKVSFMNSFFTLKFFIL